VVAGRLLGLNAGQMTNALGIAGSLSAGLMEFSKSGGGMVKRLHLGHAAESGVLAARLAASGFEGPQSVLEGKFGYLNVFCRNGDAGRFTAGLGEVWNMESIIFKRYACHSSAQIAVTAALELKARYGFSAGDIASVVVAGNEKLVSHHNIPEPQDIAMAQYSVPFCVAVAFYRDPRDPSVFCDETLNDPEIRMLARKVEVTVRRETTEGNSRATRVTVHLKDGRELTQDLEFFPGMLQQPLSRAEIKDKFVMVARPVLGAKAYDVFSSLDALDSNDNLALLELC
jgi:2-methylcitrate dehydratase PrpD